MTTPAVSILGTGSYLPEHVATNAVLAEAVGVDEDWIVAKTGVRGRRVAAAHEATSDLAVHAARRALDAAEVHPHQIDLLLVATSTPDELIPASACHVQAELGAHNAAAFDINAVCTGFIYGLASISAMMRGDPELGHALVIGADTYSRILDYSDRKTAVLFGDGAGAAVLGRTPHPGILATTLGSDGALADLVRVPAGGSRLPASISTLVGGDHWFKMNGRGVRDFVDRVFPEIIRASLKSADLVLDDIALLVPHQANGVLLAQCAEAMSIPGERMHRTVERYGNTGAASVAITLDDAVRNGRVTPGDLLLLAAFGGGMTWGGVILQWNPALSQP